jgi:putative ATP-dependent endonuclease of OLD family
MHVRRLTIQRFRGIKHLEFCPGPCTIILGPNNSGKSTILEALDLLLHPGFGRPRAAPEEVDYYRRDPDAGFEIEAVLGALPVEFRAEVHQHLEGWQDETGQLVAEPDGDGVEPVVRVRVRGTSEFEHLHEFAKPEANGAHFYPRLRQHVGWIFDGRRRDPARQLYFYQGGLLDRVFADADLGPALAALRQAVREGAESVNTDRAVGDVLSSLSSDLEDLGLLADGDSIVFEPSAVSRRTLLQALRLAISMGEDIAIPLERQGRGAQRLALVAVLLRLAESTGHTIVGAFEEPEEALEPLRQAHLSSMLAKIVDGGGQIFLVTHSPDLARSFGIDTFLLLKEGGGGGGARHLERHLTPPCRQAYERRLDGPVVRGLFCHVPVLVEGPSDRAVMDTLWAELARQGRTLPPFRLGLDIINAEGVNNMPMLAAVLAQAGKAVVPWAEQDTEGARGELKRLRAEENCAALVLHDPEEGRSNLECALAWSVPVAALAAGLTRIAGDRAYDWEAQRRDLLSRCSNVDSLRVDTAKEATSLLGFLGALAEDEARTLIALALGSKQTSPFDLKGARQGRLFAEALVEAHGVPPCFADAYVALDGWIRRGCPRGYEIQMRASV